MVSNFPLKDQLFGQSQRNKKDKKNTFPKCVFLFTARKSQNWQWWKKNNPLFHCFIAKPSKPWIESWDLTGEDVNRTTKKPYRELKDSEGRPDEEVELVDWVSTESPVNWEFWWNPSWGEPTSRESPPFWQWSHKMCLLKQWAKGWWQ